jgi:hypothetical protein
MRALISPRAVVALAFAGVLSACGGSSPTAPAAGSTSTQMPSGPQVLRINFLSLCQAAPEPRLIPFVMTRVTVTRAGSEWIAATSSAGAGDVEVRLRESGGAASGFFQIAGTIRGTAVNMPDLTGSFPEWPRRVEFPADGSTAVSGVAFTLNSLTPGTGISGVGSGTVTLSDDTGASCRANAFSWSLTAPQ